MSKKPAPSSKNPLKSHRHWVHVTTVVLILAVLVPAIILAAARQTTDVPFKDPSTVSPSTEEILQIPNDFNLEDKIGQLLMVGVTSQKMAVSLEKNYQIGGFLLRPGSGLFSKKSVDAVKQAGELPALVAVDEEGGQVARLPGADFSQYSARYMGGLSDAEVQRIGDRMGQEMVFIGANVDFAPVVDLDDGHNAAISALDRSFSDSPVTVAQKAQAFAAGLRQAGVVPTFKHFPGLGRADGATGGNTDTGPATSPALTSLQDNDLVPYNTVLQPGLTSAVMVGNQIVPDLTGGDPASISSAAYTLLRDDYGFQQVTFTDELMLAKAVANVEPDPATAVIDAIKAGADMPLIDPPDTETVGSIIQAVSRAVQNGDIKQSRLDAALDRILQLKTSIKEGRVRPLG